MLYGMVVWSSAFEQALTALPTCQDGVEVRPVAQINLALHHYCGIRPDYHYHFDASGTSNAMFDELAERSLSIPLAPRD